MPINEEIRTDKVRLIGADGQQLGIVSLDEALKEAKASSLDLVQMAKDGNPLVCKLMDHGNHIFLCPQANNRLTCNSHPHD